MDAENSYFLGNAIVAEQGRDDGRKGSGKVTREGGTDYRLFGKLDEICRK